jgi:dTDP-glucose 4,6-dehydratase
MRIIVTGGAGFIGSAVCRQLIETTDAQITNIDTLTYAGSVASLWEISRDSRHRLVRANICDAAALNRVFEETKPDAVIHLAAESHVDRSINGARAFIDTNVVGTFNLLEASRRHWASLNAEAKSRFRFLHVSTDELYGSLGPQGAFTESSRYDPSSPYSATKAAADHLVISWHRTYGLPVVIASCSNNYGPYQFPEKLIPLTLLNALEGKPLTLYGDGSNVRDWLYVMDHVRALELILKEGRIGQIYNIGGHSERSNQQTVTSICKILDQLVPSTQPYERLITYVSDRPCHDQRHAIDCSKIETELGWRTQETFESGLAKTVRWYLDNDWWWRPLRQRVYGGDRLGLISTQPQMGRM